MKYYFKFLISKQSSSKNLHQTRSHHMKRFAIQITAAAESIEKPTPKTFVLLFHHHHLLPYFLICVCCRSLSFGMQRNACRCVIYHLLNLDIDEYFCCANCARTAVLYSRSAFIICLDLIFICK